MVNRVLIVSELDDLHGLVIQEELRSRNIECVIVGSDAVSGAETINIHLDSTAKPVARLRTSCGKIVDPGEFTTVWWRRYKPDQMCAADVSDPQQRSLMNNDCHASLRGTIEATFDGKWVSSPSATENASNKINQLAAAAKVGFEIPATLVSQSSSAIRSFVRHVGKVIYKPVAGTKGPLLFTRFLDPDDFPEDVFLASPTIYQAFVPGERHIRLNAFGNRSFASMIQSRELDWRPDLTVPISRWDVPRELQELISKLLAELQLAMGIFDVKLTPDERFVFLEVNPQGQFLFLEAATGEKLASHMADFLTE